ncbi:hypothetical protein DFQ30_003910 [Apophysomyces sp. BC1015]|nr:hypothetical protein DFQ30_003910 [Apophysomyces sp. BC1015]
MYQVIAVFQASCENHRFELKAWSVTESTAKELLTYEITEEDLSNAHDVWPMNDAVGYFLLRPQQLIEMYKDKLPDLTEDSHPTAEMTATSQVSMCMNNHNKNNLGRSLGEIPVFEAIPRRIEEAMSDDNVLQIDINKENSNALTPVEEILGESKCEQSNSAHIREEESGEESVNAITSVPVEAVISESEREQSNSADIREEKNVSEITLVSVEQIIGEGERERSNSLDIREENSGEENVRNFTPVSVEEMIVENEYKEENVNVIIPVPVEEMIIESKYERSNSADICEKEDIGEHINELTPMPIEEMVVENECEQSKNTGIREEDNDKDKNLETLSPLMDYDTSIDGRDQQYDNIDDMATQDRLKPYVSNEIMISDINNDNSASDDVLEQGFREERSLEISPTLLDVTNIDDEAKKSNDLEAHDRILDRASISDGIPIPGDEAFEDGSRESDNTGNVVTRLVSPEEPYTDNEYELLSDNDIHDSDNSKDTDIVSSPVSVDELYADDNEEGPQTDNSFTGSYHGKGGVGDPVYEFSEGSAFDNVYEEHSIVSDSGVIHGDIPSSVEEARFISERWQSDRNDSSERSFGKENSEEAFAAPTEESYYADGNWQSSDNDFCGSSFGERRVAGKESSPDIICLSSEEIGSDNDSDQSNNDDALESDVGSDPDLKTAESIEEAAFDGLYQQFNYDDNLSSEDVPIVKDQLALNEGMVREHKQERHNNSDVDPDSLKKESIFKTHLMSAEEQLPNNDLRTLIVSDESVIISNNGDQYNDYKAVDNVCNPAPYIYSGSSSENNHSKQSKDIGNHSVSEEPNENGEDKLFDVARENTIEEDLDSSTSFVADSIMNDTSSDVLLAGDSVNEQNDITASSVHDSTASEDAQSVLEGLQIHAMQTEFITQALLSIDISTVVELAKLMGSTRESVQDIIPWMKLISKISPMEALKFMVRIRGSQNELELLSNLPLSEPEHETLARYCWQLDDAMSKLYFMNYCVKRDRLGEAVLLNDMIQSGLHTSLTQNHEAVVDCNTLALKIKKEIKPGVCRFPLEIYGRPRGLCKLQAEKVNIILPCVAYNPFVSRHLVQRSFFREHGLSAGVQLMCAALGGKKRPRENDDLPIVNKHQKL